MPFRKPASLFAPHLVFLYLGLPALLVLGIITPPFLVLDESTHFYRAYQVSELGFVAVKTDEGRVGGSLPISLRRLVYHKPLYGIAGAPDSKIHPSDTLEMFKVPLAPKVRGFLHFPNSAFYTPASYFPQALGIALARLFTDSAIAMLYAGRLGNILAFCLLVFFAIRTAPILKWVFVLLAFMPKTLYQSASLSTDTLLFSLSFYLIALILKIAYDVKNPVARRDIALMIATSLVLALCKQAYFLIPLLYFLVPVKRMGDWKKYVGVFVLMMGSIVLFVGLWSILVKKLFVAATPGVNLDEQLAFILSNPILYLRIFVTTLLREDSMVKLMGRLGWHDTAVPALLIWGHFMALVTATFVERPKDIEISWRDRALTFAVLFASVGLFATLLYLTWNPVGNLAIRGIQQGRYYIPLFPMAFLLIYKIRIPGLKLPTLDLKIPGGKILTFFSALSLLWTIVIVWQRYYY